MERASEEPEGTKEIVTGGETVIGDNVVASIVGMATKEVEGVAGLGKSSIRRALTEHLGRTTEKAKLGVGVEVGKEEAVVDITLDVIYGYNIPKIVDKVREKVAARLLDITGLVAKEININIASIELPHEKKPAKEK